MLREDVDSIEDPILEADPRPSVQRWLAQRRAVEAQVGGHQRRLYFVLMYCDDNIIGVVGVDRAVRVLKAWRTLTQKAGLIMAIPEKRSIGVWCTWIGALIFASLGLIVIPRAKLIRASTAIRNLTTYGIPFSEYRSLVGLLEHFRDVARVPRNHMHGLYTPHRLLGTWEEGPNELVRLTYTMQLQFQRWMDIIGRCGGCAVTKVLQRKDISQPAMRTFVSSSDAATDSVPPAMGGYMHGFYWHRPIALDDLQWLHITVLELLACGFTVMFGARIRPSSSFQLTLVDATLVCSLLHTGR